MTSTKYVHTLYSNTNINKKAHFQNYQSYMCTYPLYTCKYSLQKHKHKQVVLLPKLPVLHVYIPSTATITQTKGLVCQHSQSYMCKHPLQQHNHKKRLIAKITSLICLHTLYNNTNKNTKACCQNDQSYMCTYPLQHHKHRNKGLLPKLPVLHVYILSTTTQK